MVIMEDMEDMEDNDLVMETSLQIILSPLEPKVMIKRC